MSFQRVDATTPIVRFSFDGQDVEARAGDSIAAALLAAGADRLRSTPISGRPRLPYCLMGVCFDCLVEIDGEANRQACMVEATEGMQVRRQHMIAELQP